MSRLKYLLIFILCHSNALAFINIWVPLKYSSKPSICSHKDRQWSLFEKSFSGKWFLSHTYVYNNSGTLNTIIYQNKTVEFAFLQNNSCILTSKDMKLRKDTRILKFSKNDLIFDGKSIILDGCASGRRCISNKLLSFEINLFHNNITRFMVIIYYQIFQTYIKLHSVQMNPFRNMNYQNYTLPTLSFKDICQKMLNNYWESQQYVYTSCDKTVYKLPINFFNLRPYSSYLQNATNCTFDNGIVIVPKIIHNGEDFRLLLGVMMNDTVYKQVALYYDDIYSNITKCIYDTYIIKDLH
jgi:hypothetical protein